MDITIEDVMSEVIKFRDERDWKQFHKPKDLAISLSLEASELLECFQWKSETEVDEFLKNADSKTKLQEEIADVGAYLLLICNETGIDLKQAILDKIQKNEKKYPVELSKGSSKKYTEF